MQYIMLNDEEINKIYKKLDEISQSVNVNIKRNPLKEVWLDVSETCQLLKISKRTLQSYRDNGILSFSQIAGKIYFKASDIEEHLQKHYVKGFKH